MVEYAPGVDEAEAKAEILKTALKVEPDFRFEDLISCRANRKGRCCS